MALKISANSFTSSILQLNQGKEKIATIAVKRKTDFDTLRCENSRTFQNWKADRLLKEC